MAADHPGEFTVGPVQAGEAGTAPPEAVVLLGERALDIEPGGDEQQAVIVGEGRAAAERPLLREQETGA